MKERIQQELRHLEEQLDIKILYAVESGSRAWGFASADSDWDVRFLYIHRPEWYLQIDTERDSYEKMLPNEIDLSGWELRKALRLFRKSNPPMLEWLHSPLIYSEPFTTAARLRALESSCFSPRSCLHHYLHMAENNFKEYLLRDRVRVKKYFYVIRPLLACDWIRDRGTMPPVEFAELLNGYAGEGAVRREIDILLERKMAGGELGEAPRNHTLHAFLEAKLHEYQHYVKQLPSAPEPGTERLNELFRETLAEVWA
ncbi:MAG: nucleotidyltransferase domain-containing protein [Flavobacteriales bacterium]